MNEHNGYGGINVNMEDDREILAINSPQTGEFQIGGPWFVVQKNIEERRAVAALECSGTARLGERFFTEENGSPTSRGYPVWNIITDKSAETAILETLDARIKEIISDFLSENKTKITGKELYAISGIKTTLELLHVEQNTVIELCYKCYRDIVKIRNDYEAREKETRKWKDFARELENKCKSVNISAEINQIVEELKEKHFG